MPPHVRFWIHQQISLTFEALSLHPIILFTLSHVILSDFRNFLLFRFLNCRLRLVHFRFLSVRLWVFRLLCFRLLQLLLRLLLWHGRP